jgi:hypothetical protein
LSHQLWQVGPVTIHLTRRGPEVQRLSPGLRAAQLPVLEAETILAGTSGLGLPSAPVLREQQGLPAPAQDRS